MAATALTGTGFTRSLYSDGLNEVYSGSLKRDMGMRPYALSFSCSRLRKGASLDESLTIDGRLKVVFDNALKGLAHLNMDSNPLGCPVSKDMGHCGNLRGRLWECRCTDLDRKRDPSIRHRFEDNLIAMILNSLQMPTHTVFELNLAIFCSGGLLGEEILLFRLFDEMKKRNLQGTINLFFVDGLYADSVNREAPDEMIKQFLKEICICLPENVQVRGAFFKHSDEYIKAASVDDHFKHDLAFGADLDGEHGKLQEFFVASRSSYQPIVLIRKGSDHATKGDKLGGKVCLIDRAGKLQDCYDPSPHTRRLSLSGSAQDVAFAPAAPLAPATAPPATRPARSGSDSTSTALLIGGSAIGLGLAIVLFMFLSRRPGGLR